MSAAPGDGPAASLWESFWPAAMFRASPVAFALADENGLLVLANDAYCRLVGRDHGWLMGRSSREFTHPDDLAQHAAMGQLMHEAQQQNAELRVKKGYIRPDGEIRWGWVSAAPVSGPQGERWNMAVVYDTTARRGAEDRLLTEATTDPLTGLLNRRGWLHKAEMTMQTWDQIEPITVAIIDLDHFKMFNDTHGHQAGDTLLSRFGSALRADCEGETLYPGGAVRSSHLPYPNTIRRGPHRYWPGWPRLFPTGRPSPRVTIWSAPGKAFSIACNESMITSTRRNDQAATRSSPHLDRSTRPDKC